MKTDFLEQLKYYKDEIGADYVRLGGTFTDSRTQTIFSLSDLYDIPNARKFVTRTFRLCGEAYDCILRVGVKPVSYTHLDVYKRQVETVRLSTLLE